MKHMPVSLAALAAAASLAPYSALAQDVSPVPATSSPFAAGTLPDAAFAPSYSPQFALSSQERWTDGRWQLVIPISGFERGERSPRVDFSATNNAFGPWQDYMGTQDMFDAAEHRWLRSNKGNPFERPGPDEIEFGWRLRLELGGNRQRGWRSEVVVDGDAIEDGWRRVEDAFSGGPR